MGAVVADGWPVLRQGVAEVLAECGISSVQPVATATEALALVAAGDVDVLVLGSVADMEVPAAVDRVVSSGSGVRVVALVEGRVRDDAIAALDAGAGAVLARQGTVIDLREAVLRVSAGQRFVAPAVLEAAFGPDRATDTETTPFTPRELEVLRLLAGGRSNAQIAAALFVGEATVKTHLHNAYAKLGVANRFEAVREAQARGLLGGH